jgi:hypothetical protein
MAGPGGRRRGWSKLSASYRRRLARSGITRQEWEAGADLRAARGHRPKPPSYAAPVDAVDRWVHNKGTNADEDALRAWREASGPDWIPGEWWVSIDVAGALSQLPPPSTWSHVDFYPAAGEPWRMVVYPAHGYPVEIEIPADSAREVLGLLSEPEAYGLDTDEWDFWDPGDFDVHAS